MSSTSVILLIVTMRSAVSLLAPALDLNEFNHELEAEFLIMDLDKNNKVTEPEMETIIYRQDYDGDGCISFSEWVKARKHDSLRFSWALFVHFDHDENGCLEHGDQLDEFDEIDINPKDGSFTLQEFDEYYDKLYLKIGIPMTGNPVI